MHLSILLALLLTLGAAAPSLAQDDSQAEQPTVSPLRSAMELAREVIEEDLGETMRLRRWRFYEDDWSSMASLDLYQSFGIDNCTASVPIGQKRDHILFGWTFTFDTTAGEAHQARVSYDLQDTIICDEAHIPPRYAPAPAPAAESSEAEGAESQTPAVSTANIGGFALGGHVAGLDGAAISAMNSAGMTWVKKQVIWGQSDGRDIIAQAHAQGFKVVLGALGSKRELEADFDGYIQVFADYVADLAEYGADAIEVWNEPNIQHEWPSGQINGGSYTRLLQAAYQAIKARNPSTLVISGAPAPTGFSQTGCQAELCNDDVFVRQMAQAGAANYLDCVGVHYNAGAVPPDATSGAPVGSAGHYSWYLPSMMSVYRGAFPSKPLCFTELGYVTGEGLGALPSAFAWAQGNTLAEQASWLAGAVNVARGSGYVDMIIVWNVNFTAWGGADPQRGYAIIRPDGGCPACSALRGAMGL